MFKNKSSRLQIAVVSSDISVASQMEPLEPRLLLSHVPILVKTDIATGKDALSSTAGDFNGDGNLDLIVANNGVNTLSFLPGNGDGTLNAKSDINLTTHPLSPAWDAPYLLLSSDLNGDGKLDLIFSRMTGGGFSVLMGNGDGTFGNRKDQAGDGSYPYGMVLADFNGDGKQDIAVQAVGSFQIFTGNGDGSFTKGAIYADAGTAYSIAAGDITGDGKLDIVVPNRSLNSISVFPGNGNGTFGNATDYPTGSSPQWVELADLNKDSKVDIVTANNLASGSVSVLLNNSSGGLLGHQEYSVGSKPYSSVITDFNGDGNLDIITANSDSNNVSVLSGNGTGTFSAPANTATGTLPYGLTLAYLNLKPCLVTANEGAAGISVLVNNCVNQSPAAVDDTLTTSKNSGPAVVNVLANDTDPDGDVLSVLSVGTASHGTTSLVAGVVRYTPMANYNGDDSFTYVTWDKFGGTDTATVNVTVNPSNVKPTAISQTVSVGEDFSAAFALGASDVETLYNGLAFNVPGAAGHGTLAYLGTLGNYSYTPAWSYTGTTDSFTFTVTDTGDPAGSHANPGDLTSDPAIVTFQIVSNNSYTGATDMGTLVGPVSNPGGLSSGNDVDWYKFVLLSTGDANSSVTIQFVGASGAIKAALYTNPAQSGAVAYGVDAANSETISLSGRAAGTYYVRIWGATARAYSLILTPAAPPPAPTNVQATDSTYYDKVRLTWTAAPTATGYDVYRNTANDSSSAVKVNGSTVTGMTYDDTTITPGTTYYYWVKAKNATGSSDFSAGDSGLCAVIGAPAGVTGSEGTFTDRVTIAWTASAGATGYDVYRSSDNNLANAVKINGVTITGTSYDDTATGVMVIHYYWVLAKNALGASDFSSRVFGFIQPVPAPGGVAASDNTFTDKIQITWTASTGATAYDVYRNTANDSTSSTKINASDVTGTSYNDTTVVAGTTYYYWVIAKCPLSNSSYSLGDSGVCAPLAVPTGLIAGDAGNTDMIAVVWNASAGAGGYDVYRSLTNDSSTSTKINVSSVTATWYNDASVTAQTTYYYWVKATNAVGSSDYSAGDAGSCALVSAPTSVAASDSTFTDRVQVTWTASSGAAAYDVYRNTVNNSGTAGKLNGSDVTGTSYNDTTAVAGTTYYYWVKARNNAGTSAFSLGDTGTRLAATLEVEPNAAYTSAQNLGTITSPSTVIASLSSTSDVDWYKFTLASPADANSKVVFSFSGAAGTVKAALYADPAKSGVTVSGVDALNAETVSLAGRAIGTYYLRVWGTKALSYTFVITPAGPPAAPTGVAATDGTSTDKVTVSWTASTGATAYDVYRNGVNDSGTATKLNGSDITGTSYDDTTAVASTTYYYWVKARNGAGASAFSSGDAGTRAVLVAPAAPTGVAATDNTYSDKVRVTWAAANLATAYDVYRSQTNDSNTSVKLNGSDITGTSYDDTTAVAGTTYYYWVKARNGAGSSGYSVGDSGVRSVGPAQVTEVEPNNVYTTAQNLNTVNSPLQVNGSLSTVNDVDWFKFVLPAKGTANSKIQITFAGASGKLRAAIYADPAKSGVTVYGVDAVNSETISLNGLAAGTTYYVRVYGYLALPYTMLITPS